MYRSILAKRAREVESYPDCTLITRTTTKHASCATRYANDCYSLQLFINNRDTREVTDVFTKKYVKTEQPIVTEDTQMFGLTSITIQLQCSLSEIHDNALRQEVNSLQSQRSDDHKCIFNLRKKKSNSITQTFT